MLFQIILSMDNWLRASPTNVAVVHWCAEKMGVRLFHPLTPGVSMGGKGRTGTVIACYLLYCGLYDDPAAALSYFAEKRSRIAKGVIQPSQLRYVRYFGLILNQRQIPHVVDVCIKKIVLRGVPLFSKKREGCKAILKVYNVSQLPKRLLFASGDPQDESLFVDAAQGSITWLPEVVTRGDVLIKCKHYGAKRKETIFKTTFHTAFVEPVAQLDMKDLDAIIKPKKRSRPDQYPENFAVVITFEKPTAGDDGTAPAAATAAAPTTSLAVPSALLAPTKRNSFTGRRHSSNKLKSSSPHIGGPSANTKACTRCLIYIAVDAAQCPLCRATQSAAPGSQ